MPRRIPGDWHPGSIPDNAAIDPASLIETALCFESFRSTLPRALEVGPGSALYTGTMLDVGPSGRVRIGSYCMLNNMLIVCDRSVEIGDYALISWNVAIMDSYRASPDRQRRRASLRRAAAQPDRRLHDDIDARPVRIGSTVWIGFESCILPGVTIGDGSIVGARSVVASDIPAGSIAAGNPARVIRRIADGGASHA